MGTFLNKIYIPSPCCVLLAVSLHPVPLADPGLYWLCSTSLDGCFPRPATVERPTLGHISIPLVSPSHRPLPLRSTFSHMTPTIPSADYIYWGSPLLKANPSEA